jgi:hypothetical protein
MSRAAYGRSSATLSCFLLLIAERICMKRCLFVSVAVAASLFAALAVAPLQPPLATVPVAYAKPCSSGYVHASLSWGHKCLRVGQFCKIKGDREYHRYRFHCHTGRLSRSSSGSNGTGPGCQPGYSPCLPRVADLNCSDIPASKKPIRVTGSDPYRLDGDGDGIACEP